jgi:hypothetical protein
MLTNTSMKLAPFPTPNHLIEKWQRGEIEREEMQSLMKQHQLALLEEAEEYHRNPIAGYLEGLLNKRAANLLIKAHGEASIREILLAMSHLQVFPPSAYLWNADHWDVSLHAFFRTRSAPVFRIREIMVKSTRAVLLIEHGSPKKSETTLERITLERNWRGDMEVVMRETL